MTDAQKWLDLKAGNHSAFETIYKDHADYLVRYGFKISRNDALVEDAVHDLFVEIWKNRSTIGTTDNIRAYLTVALRRKIIKSLQRIQKTQSDQAPEDCSFGAELAIDEVIINTERSSEWAHQLQNAMSKLSDRQREVLYMKFYGEMNNEEISEALGINNQSVRNLVHRSLDHLKKMFIWLVLILFF